MSRCQIRLIGAWAVTCHLFPRPRSALTSWRVFQGGSPEESPYYELLRQDINPFYFSFFRWERRARKGSDKRKTTPLTYGERGNTQRAIDGELIFLSVSSPPHRTSLKNSPRRWPTGSGEFGNDSSWRRKRRGRPQRVPWRPRKSCSIPTTIWSRKTTRVMVHGIRDSGRQNISRKMRSERDVLPDVTIRSAAAEWRRRKDWRKTDASKRHDASPFLNRLRKLYSTKRRWLNQVLVKARQEGYWGHGKAGWCTLVVSCFFFYSKFNNSAWKNTSHPLQRPSE